MAMTVTLNFLSTSVFFSSSSRDDIPQEAEGNNFHKLQILVLSLYIIFISHPLKIHVLIISLGV